VLPPDEFPILAGRELVDLDADNAHERGLRALLGLPDPK
jgi:hypothetical protein